MTDSIPLLTTESRLKRKIRKHLKELGFVRSTHGWIQPELDGKQGIRDLHFAQRRSRFNQTKTLLDREWETAQAHFAEGKEIRPSSISPELVEVQPGTSDSHLFRIATLLWSIPVSQGFGRRIRYLVRDTYNNKLIGLAALGDPVFNLASRDKWIGWSGEDKKKRMVNVLDAYVLGAVPPYNQLLGGKLVASMLKSTDVVNRFREKYHNTTGHISGEKKGAELTLLTTSSALGRSSLYNRLKIGDEVFFSKVGSTVGWGHFHFSDELFNEMRSYLSEIDHPYFKNNRFGQGPNWRFRATREALHHLGFKQLALKHGIQREVYVCPLATNTRDNLVDAEQPDYSELRSSTEVAEMAIDRWILPRSERNMSYLNWTKAETKSLFQPKGSEGGNRDII